MIRRVFFFFFFFFLLFQIRYFQKYEEDRVSAEPSFAFHYCKIKSVKREGKKSGRVSSRCIMQISHTWYFRTVYDPQFEVITSGHIHLSHVSVSPVKPNRYLALIKYLFPFCRSTRFLRLVPFSIIATHNEFLHLELSYRPRSEILAYLYDCAR